MLKKYLSLSTNYFKQIISNFKLTNSNQSSLVLSKLESQSKITGFSSFTNEQLNTLRTQFNNPQYLIQKLIKNYIDLYPSKTPKLRIQPVLNNSCWRVILEIEWPVKFKIEAKSVSKQNAIDYVYLMACQNLKQFGFITDTDIVDTKKIIFQDLVEKGRLFYINKLPLQKTWKIKLKQEKKIWRCKLKFNWPMNLVCVSEGLTEQSAIKNSQLIAVSHLKGLSFLDKNNEFINKLNKTFNTSLTLYRENLLTKHDFEIYTDASPFGFGGYLVNLKDKYSPIEYFYDKYPDEFKQNLSKIYRNGKRISDLNNVNEYNLEDLIRNEDELLSRFENKFVLKRKSTNFKIYRDFEGFDANLAEMYASLTALNTWKKLIKKSRVIIYTDSQFVCSLLKLKHFKSQLNDNEYDLNRHNLIFNVNSIIYKLFNEYSIELLIEYIVSSQNDAADSLSRFLESKFNIEISVRYKRQSNAVKILPNHVAHLIFNLSNDKNDYSNMVYLMNKFIKNESKFDQI